MFVPETGIIHPLNNMARRSMISIAEENHQQQIVTRLPKGRRTFPFTCEIRDDTMIRNQMDQIGGLVTVTAGPSAPKR